MTDEEIPRVVPVLRAAGVDDLTIDGSRRSDDQLDAQQLVQFALEDARWMLEKTERASEDWAKLKLAMRMMSETIQVLDGVSADNFRA